MRKFNEVIEDVKAPNTQSLWLNEGNLSYYGNNGWESISSSGSTNTNRNNIEITYAELKDMRDNDTLIPGMWYRITDYICTTTQQNTQSAENKFDIIVLATSVNSLSEQARAINHTPEEGETDYFASCRLSDWKIWYCLDNDTTRFAWADSINGKGVIYKMIDEFNNDLPYDFKNIKFKHPINTTTYPYYYYTFTYSNVVNNTDVSLTASYIIRNNTMGACMQSNKQTLNNNVFIGDVCENNSFGNDFYCNSFDNYCKGNFFGDYCQGNSFGSYCYDNFFGNSCSYNSFGNRCSYNFFDVRCSYNFFGNYCYNNSFGSDCRYIKFASTSDATTRYDYYQNNHFGDGCQYILLKGAGTGSSSQQVKNYRFAQGTSGTSNTYIVIEGKRGLDYETFIGKDKSNKIKETVNVEGLGKIIDVIWSDLKTLRDGFKLIPGQKYRITDYVTTTSQENTKSANHKFDIIVVAIDSANLSEIAMAMIHKNDNYFQFNKLNSWKIWYCLDNNTSRFKWADTTEGKGVIYRMIDEFNNDLPYDFKNIQFKSPKDTESNIYYYTFSNGNTIDNSLTSNGNIYNNTIGAYIENGIQILNNNVFLGTHCKNNSFGTCSHHNLFGNSTLNNSFGNNCAYNFFDTGCDHNSFGNNCINNLISYGCDNNSFGNGCQYIKFAESEASDATQNKWYRNNHFGDNCKYIVFTGAYSESSLDYVQNYSFAQGLQGTSDAYLIINGIRNRNYETKVAKNSSGELKVYCEADLVQ